MDSVTYRRDMDEAEAMVTRILRKAPHPTPAASAQPLNAPGAWDFFLSHGQAAAGDAVKTLCLLLKEMKKPNGEPYTVWYDNDMTDKSTAAMEEVRRSPAHKSRAAGSIPPLPRLRHTPSPKARDSEAALSPCRA